MKTLSRVLIILTVFAIVMGITYVAVNTGSSSTSENPLVFERSGENFPPLNGERPEFGDAGPGGGSWMFGLVKNIGVVAMIVTLIVVPKNFVQRKVVPIRVK